MKTSSLLRRFWILIAAYAAFAGIPACTSGVGTSSPSPILGEVTKSAFIVGSPFPADIDIVDKQGLRDVAFITTATPASVLAVDLNANPLALSSVFAGLPSLPPEASSGLPINLFVMDVTHAVLLTSTSLIYFSPLNGAIYQTVDLTGPVELAAPLAQVDADGFSTGTVSGSFVPTFPSSVAVQGNRVAVTFSNLSFSGFSLSGATQGMLRLFDIQGETLAPASPAYAATSGFNTSGLTSLPNGTAFLVTNSGLTRFTDDFLNQLPVTEGSADLINPLNGETLGHVGLGLTTPAFRSWAVHPDGHRVFIGSGSGGYLMEIDLSTLQVVHGASDPLVVTNAANGTDFIDEVVMGHGGGGLYAFSFNHSSVYGFDLTLGQTRLLPEIIDLSFPDNPGATGAGPAALRPGNPGVDFTGPDLFVLTGSPGTVAAIKTY